MLDLYTSVYNLTLTEHIVCRELWRTPVIQLLGGLGLWSLATFSIQCQPLSMIQLVSMLPLAHLTSVCSGVVVQAVKPRRLGVR